MGKIRTPKGVEKEFFHIFGVTGASTHDLLLKYRRITHTG
jgi:hypothetical protein